MVNIASRCAGFLHKQHGGRLGAKIADEALWAEAQAALGPIGEAFDSGEYAKAVRLIMALADRANQYIDAEKPWVLAKDPEQTQTVQDVCTLGLNLFRVLMTALKPVLPKMAEAAETFLAIEPLTWEDGQRWLGNHPINPFKPLKTRLERKAVDAMVEASKSEPAPAGKALRRPPQGGEGADAFITIDQFATLDLRAALVLKAETVEGADKLLRLTLDVGPWASARCSRAFAQPTNRTPLRDALWCCSQTSRPERCALAFPKAWCSPPARGERHLPLEPRQRRHPWHGDLLGPMSEPLLSALAETPWLAVRGSALLLLLTLPAAPGMPSPWCARWPWGYCWRASRGEPSQPSASARRRALPWYCPSWRGSLQPLALRPAEPSGPTAPLRPLILLSPALLLWAFAGAEPRHALGNATRPAPAPRRQPAAVFRTLCSA